MLIILEGVDKTGKTTLAEHIARRLYGLIELRHCGFLTRHPLVEYEADLDDYAPGCDHHIIYDRHAWGERVWPTIYERETQYTPAMHRHVEMFLRSRGALVVLCTADEDLIIERLKADDDPHPPHSKVRSALRMFRGVQHASELMSLEYDFARVDMSTFIEYVIMYAQFLESPLRAFPTTHWVGHPAPSVLLVGDRPGPAFPQYAAAPFRPFRGTAGEYLMQALPRGKFALTNTFDAHGAPVPLAALVDAMRVTEVVALGNVADEALTAAGVPHGTVPHPQYVRRFHHHRSAEYAAMIWRAAGGKDLRSEAKKWTS